MTSIDWGTGGWAIDLLETALEPLRGLRPALEIETKVYVAQPEAVATSKGAKAANLVVVDSRGRGGFTSLLPGSTATQVLGTVAVPR